MSTDPVELRKQYAEKMREVSRLAAHGDKVVQQREKLDLECARLKFERHKLIFEIAELKVEYDRVGARITALNREALELHNQFEYGADPEKDPELDAYKTLFDGKDAEEK